MESRELIEVHWDIARLLEMGLDGKFIAVLSENEIRDLLKGLLYLKERYSGFMSD